MLVPAEIWTVARTEQGSAVLVRPIGSDSAVPIMIGQLEAQSIMIGLAKHTMPRPLTHDLLITLAKELGGQLVRIEITSLKEGTFFARLIVGSKGKEVPIDSRPSDSIALAVRVQCPIYIDEQVVDEAGVPINIMDEDKPDEKTKKQQQIFKLKTILEKAVEEENYEEAARIRDQIKKLENDFNP